MSRRLHKSWTVSRSIEDETAERCVDFFDRGDGSFGFEEFRRDFEDQGRWTPVHYFSDIRFGSLEDARKAALTAVAWLGSNSPNVTR
jgi:hypothetical protein